MALGQLPVERLVRHNQSDADGGGIEDNFKDTLLERLRLQEGPDWNRQEIIQSSKGVVRKVKLSLVGEREKALLSAKRIVGEFLYGVFGDTEEYDKLIEAHISTLEALNLDQLNSGKKSKGGSPFIDFGIENDIPIIETDEAGEIFVSFETSSGNGLSSHAKKWLVANDFMAVDRYY